MPNENDDTVDLSDSGDEEEEQHEENESTALIGKERRGTLWFKERKLHQDEGISADVLAELPKLAAAVTPVGNDGTRWRLHSIQVEKFLNAGFFRLDRLLGTEGIHDLPVNDAGKSLLLRESLFRDLLTGNRILKDVPQADAAAAQRDLLQLSLRQLVHIKARNIDFAPGGNSVHADFLSMLSQLIFERLGQKAADSSDATEVPFAKRLGRDLVLIVAAGKQKPEPYVWTTWFGDVRLFFHMGRLACTEVTGMALSECGSEGVFEFLEKSEPDRIAGDGRLVLSLIVKQVKNESELAPAPTDSMKGAQSLATKPNELKNVLGSLKKVPRG
jgi:hypothetical protein